MTDMTDPTIATTTSTETTTAPIPTYSLDDLLPTELRQDPSIKDIPDVETMAKVLKDTKKYVGDSIRKPSAEASAEDRRAFLNKLSDIPEIIIKPFDNTEESITSFKTKLGIPSSEDGYTYTFDEGTELPIDAEFVKRFNKFAKDHDLTKDQAERMLKGEIDSINKVNAATKAAQEDSTTKLKTLWGQAYEDKMAKVESAITLLKTKMPEDVAVLETSGLMNNPVIKLLLADQGSLLAEKSAQGVSFKPANKTPADAEQMIKEIRNNKTHPYNLAYHPEHEKAVIYMSKLYDMATNQAKE